MGLGPCWHQSGAATVAYSNGEISGDKYLLNAGVGLFGIFGGPLGTSTAVTYFGGAAILSILAEEAVGGGVPPPTIADLPY